MSEDMSDIINKVQKMVNSGNIPDNVQEMLKNLNNKQASSTNSTASTNRTNGTNSTINNSFSANNSSDNSAYSNNTGLDIETILKMKSIIEKMNQKNDPRANLLYSLKPYLRESRKSKLDQYVNLLNMTKIVDLLSNDSEENKENGT